MITTSVALFSLLLLQAQPPPTAAGSDAITPLAGTWRLVPEAADPIKPAIDRAVAKMNFLIRGIARGRLQQRNPASAFVEIRREPDHLFLRIDQFTNRPHPLNGEVWKRATADGEVDITLTKFEDGFATAYANKDGRRENRFKLENGMLHMAVTITSKYLTEPVRYTLRYQRQ